jgi:hypothetical protein
MSKIKKIIKISIDFIKKTLSLCNLNKNELQGFISPLSKLHFIPYTIVTVPYSLGRTCRGVSFNENFMQDPYGKLWIAIFNGADIKDATKDLMIKFKEQKDLRVSSVVHLRNNVKLKKYPAWAFVLPWDTLSVEDKFESYPDSFYRNRSQNGLTFSNNLRSSIIETMYSLESLESKVNQMQNIFKSIKRHGLKKSSDFPNINIFVDGDEWRWSMGDAGNHRSFVCSGLDFETLEVRISSIIYRNKVNSWKNVKNGTYSPEEAVYIFDSYFNGSDVAFGASV